MTFNTKQIEDMGMNKKKFKCTSEAQKQAIRRSYAKRSNLSRTSGGKVPQGRTLSTYDKYLPGGKNTGSEKKRPVVVIETNARNELAVVPLSSREGKNRTRLKNYQQGQSYFKHFVEIEDNEGKPIKVNSKFKENHPNMDVSRENVDMIVNTILNHSKPMKDNRWKIKRFRKNKNPQD